MQQFKEETVILREGKLNKEMYKIISGKVAVYINYGKEKKAGSETRSKESTKRSGREE